ncbi:MAG: hypothetical protein H6658_09025 [Ardenticatenaceae bacterium]|nr:hypothetical protein [Ardenticatenaceae bacterium]
MSVQMVFELGRKQGAEAILQAIEVYKAKLKTSISRTQQHLQEFEEKYNVSTKYFLQNMAAEDLQGGDMEYIEWAGEARILEKLESELTELKNVRYQLH